MAQPDHQHLRLAIDRSLDLLRRERKPVMPLFREFYPLGRPQGRLASLTPLAG